MIKKKKLYCPYCKMIYSTENFREEHSEKICPQCAQNIEDYVQQGKIKKNKEQEREEVENKENNDSIEDSSSAEGAKVAGVSENEPLEIPRDTKKLLVIDLHKIPSVSSRTSDAKKKTTKIFLSKNTRKTFGKIALKM
jgi:hypothetical protein